MTEASWMTAADACRALAVAPQTLYAYVSRGLVRSEPAIGATRRRRYSRDDVERLRRRTIGRRDPDAAAAGTLRWGLPVLESGITLIADNRLFYRGHDAVVLARTRSVADVASLVWTGGFDHTFGDAPLPWSAERDGRLPFIARAQRALAAAAVQDPAAADLRSGRVAQTGWRILSLLAGVASPSRRAAPSIEQTLARAWRVSAAGADVLRAALVLCADHELNVSSFTARCVASAGSDPYAVVGAGLGALEGVRHGGIGLRV
jgi:citrate synthase